MSEVGIDISHRLPEPWTEDILQITDVVVLMGCGGSAEFDRMRKRSISAGTHPDDRVHPGAVAAARRVGLDLGTETPRTLSSVRTMPPLVVTECDQAHEELDPSSAWLHWSMTDPVRSGSRSAFDRTVQQLRDRISSLAPGDGPIR